MEAVPQLNTVLTARDAEKIVKLFANLELRLLIDDLKTRHDVGSLARLLADESIVPAVRGYVIVAVGGLGEKAKPAVSLLIDALGDESSHNRMCAADALHDIGAVAEEAISVLRVRSRDDDAHSVRQAATYALRRIKKESDS